MKFKPHTKITNTMIITYHGGSCNPDKNRKQKRSKINGFTKASQRRLCMYTDTLIGFIPTRIMVLTFFRQKTPEEIKYQLQKFCKKLTEYLKYSEYKTPLFIWRKFQYKPDHYEFVILSNIPDFFSEEDMILVLNYLWGIGSVITVPINKDKYKIAIQKFCMMKSENHPGSSPPGKFWGVINRRCYKNKKPKIINASLLELARLEAKALAPPDNEKFQRNIFLRNNN